MTEDIFDKFRTCLTPRQINERSHGTISTSAVYSAVNTGVLPHFRVGKRKILVPEEAFIAWVERRNV